MRLKLAQFIVESDVKRVAVSRLPLSGQAGPHVDEAAGNRSISIGPMAIVDLGRRRPPDFAGRMRGAYPTCSRKRYAPARRRRVGAVTPSARTASVSATRRDCHGIRFTGSWGKRRKTKRTRGRAEAWLSHAKQESGAAFPSAKGQDSGTAANRQQSGRGLRSRRTQCARNQRGISRELCRHIY